MCPSDATPSSSLVLVTSWHCTQHTRSAVSPNYQQHNTSASCVQSPLERTTWFPLTTPRLHKKLQFHLIVQPRHLSTIKLKFFQSFSGNCLLVSLYKQTALLLPGTEVSQREQHSSNSFNRSVCAHPTETTAALGVCTVFLYVACYKMHRRMRPFCLLWRQKLRHTWAQVGGNESSFTESLKII